MANKQATDAPRALVRFVVVEQEEADVALAGGLLAPNLEDLGLPPSVGGTTNFRLVLLWFGTVGGRRRRRSGEGG